MKKAIFYTIKKDYRRFSILTVTSEHKTGRLVARYGSSRVYGRDENGWPTNATTRDCYGRFETEEAAREAKTRLGGIFAKHQDPIERAARDLAKAKQAEDDEIAAMLKEFRQL